MEQEKNDMHKKPLPFAINGKSYEWEHQYITGEELKNLGKVPSDEELYLKVTEGYQDEHIKNHDKVDLARTGLEHFYSKPLVIVLIVNARPENWSEKKISYDQVVKLAFPDYNPNNPNVVYTVTYKHGPHPNQEGVIVKRDSVFVQNKMIFNVSKTDKS